MAKGSVKAADHDTVAVGQPPEPCADRAGSPVYDLRPAAEIRGSAGDAGEADQAIAAPAWAGVRLDENAVRRIVAGVVLAQLRGVNGVLFSPNLRKMVHREIRQMLGTDKLD
jgi:hypothetical protein